MDIRYSKRTSGVELPGAVELLDILAKESPRLACRYDYIAKNARLFDAHSELARRAGTNNEWAHDYARLPLDELVQKITATHQMMMAHIGQNPDDDIYDRVFSALVPDSDHTRSDAIFVFGSKTNARVERAVELYHASVANKIVLSGRAPHYNEQESISEADRMAHYARESGVPSSDIVIEPASITLPDNVKRTLDAMELTGWQPKSLTIVATNFVLRRALMEWYKFTPWDITIYPVASSAKSAHFQPHTWQRDAQAAALVLNEYAKIIIESRIDLLRRDRRV